MTDQRPSICRMVVYRDSAGRDFPATISVVHSDDCVNLVVFGKDGMPAQIVTSIVKGDNPHQWNWPTRV